MDSVRGALLSSLFLILAADGAFGFSPELVCESAVESEMTLGNETDFGPRGGLGFFIEDYDYRLKGAEASLRLAAPPPVAALDDFSGVRITDCSTGQIIAISTYDGVDGVSDKLLATEFLRPKIRAGKAVAYRDVQRAAKTIYGEVLLLRENVETCVCNYFYSELRPKGMRPWDERGN